MEHSRLGIGIPQLAKIAAALETKAWLLLQQAEREMENK